MPTPLIRFHSSDSIRPSSVASTITPTRRARTGFQVNSATRAAPSSSVSGLAVAINPASESRNRVTVAPRRPPKDEMGRVQRTLQSRPGHGLAQALVGAIGLLLSAFGIYYGFSLGQAKTRW